jgi:hypothetical protein
MTIPVVTKNLMLDAQSFSQLSLHTAYPGTTGTNEVSGGTPAYARKAITLFAASGGQRVNSTTINFDVPATTVRWVGAWNGATFIGAAPNGGATPRQFSTVTSTGRVISTAHGFAANQKITFFNGTTPGGLTEGVTYFAINVTTDDFQVSATSGGSAITLTSGPGYGCSMSAIVEEVYASQGTHSLTSYTFAIPD